MNEEEKRFFSNIGDSNSFSEERENPVNIDEVVRKERNAEYYYENFLRYHRNKDFKRASESLWNVINSLTYGVGLFENKKLDTYTKIIEFLGELSKRGEITEEQVRAVQGIHTNALRNILDESMFEIYVEKIEGVRRKLKNILKDKIMWGNQK